MSAHWTLEQRRAWNAAHIDEDVDFSLVYQAFQGICQGCFGPVDRNIPWPDPMSESLDHIRPISKGGRHNYENVQLMHLRCNMRKGASI
jgi:5-methylcytosine-specific restriction endonuclease McrA